MAGDDQFSFPIVAGPITAIQSSPLWQISSRVHRQDEAEERAEEEEEGGGRIRQEESTMRREVNESLRGEEEEEGAVEEKMDMLWEDLNCREEAGDKLGVAGGGRIAARGLGGGATVLAVVVRLLKILLLRNTSVSPSKSSVRRFSHQTG